MLPLPDLKLPASPSSVAFSPSGKEVAVGLLNGVVQVCDLATGKAHAMLEAHRGVVSSLAYSPDGTRLATAGADGRVKVWALEPGPDGVTGAATTGVCDPGSRRRRARDRRHTGWKRVGHGRHATAQSGFGMRAQDTGS